MAVGFPVKDDYATGDVLTAANMNDFAGTLNTVPDTIGAYAAGKNKILNGDFYINQRAFTSTTTINVFTFDRWRTTVTGDGTATYTAQTFTPGAAPVAGYEGQNYLRIVTTGQTAVDTFTDIRQRIESVRTLAGQTATVSFWAKADSGTPKVAVEFQQGFGSGGSATVQIYAGQVTLSTSWARYSLTVAIPSISGKTIGPEVTTELQTELIVSAGSNFNARTGSLGIQSNTFEFWGVQLEAGSIATPFQTATGTIQGELAACQRYYYRTTTGSGTILGIGNSYSTTGSVIYISYPVPMRIRPTALEQTGTAANYKTLRSSGAGFDSCTAVPAYDGGTSSSMAAVATLSANLTQGQVAQLFSDAAAAYLGWSAEL
jgi:hypothetical protein